MSRLHRWIVSSQHPLMCMRFTRLTEVLTFCQICLVTSRSCFCFLVNEGHTFLLCLHDVIASLATAKNEMVMLCKDSSHGEPKDASEGFLSVQSEPPCGRPRFGMVAYLKRGELCSEDPMQASLQPTSAQKQKVPGSDPITSWSKGIVRFGE
jgi:hypothetical protein